MPVLRRALKYVTVFAVVALIAGVLAYFFLPDRARTPATTTSRGSDVKPIATLAPNLYLVAGGGCNTIVFVASSGVLVVDTKFRESWRRLVEEIRSVTDKPITHVVNTHRHPDHAESNALVPPDVKVIVHSRNVERFRTWTPTGATQTQMGSAPVIYTDRFTLFDGDDAVDLIHFGPAHTDGDALVVFRSARLMAAGDVMAGKATPSIVLPHGGDAVSFANVLRRATAEIAGVDRVVTGHGPVVTWPEFRDYGALTQVMLDYVRTNMTIGARKDEVFKAFKPPATIQGFNLNNAFDTLDQMDRCLRPRWMRMWPFTR